MKTLAVLALVLSCACASAYAQECQGDACYDFSGTEWTGWDPYACPIDSGCDNTVESGRGVIGVLNSLPNPYWRDNHTHLLWTGTDGFLSANVCFNFTDDDEHTGWIEKLNDGVFYPDQCHAHDEPPRASDEIFALTVLDTGEEWCGVYWGGDERSWGVVDDPHTIALPQRVDGYSVAGIVCRRQGGLPVVLARTFLDPVPMGEGGCISISVRQNWRREWIAHAAGQRGGQLPQRWDLEVALKNTPPMDGGVGLIAAVPPAPYCIYFPGGMYDRKFSVERVVAWQ